MIEYPNRIQDQHVVKKLRELIDELNAVITKETATENALAAIHVPTLSEIQKGLSLGGTNPINITGLQGILANIQSTVQVGTHAQRLLTPAVQGLGWWETDRTLLYIGIPSGATTVWQYASGIYRDSLANQPTGLGVNDTGLLFNVNNYKHLCRWTNPVWICLDDSPGTFVESAIALGVGYQVCDGTVTDYLVFGATITTAPFTTPDEVTAPSGVYHKSAAAYSGTINAPVVPTISGNTGSTSGGTPAGTVSQPTFSGNAAGAVSVDVTVPTVSVVQAPYTPAGTVSQPTFSGSALAGHVHDGSTLTVSTATQVRNLEVMRFFRQ